MPEQRIDGGDHLLGIVSRFCGRLEFFAEPRKLFLLLLRRPLLPERLSGCLEIPVSGDDLLERLLHAPSDGRSRRSCLPC